MLYRLRGSGEIIAIMDPPAPAGPGSTADGTASRRATLRLFGLAGLGLVAGACSSGTEAAPSSPSSSSTVGATSTSTTAATTSTAAGTCVATPTETGGPFPADGTNDNGRGQTANLLDDEGIIRGDIRSDLDGTDPQEGVPFTLKMKVRNASCAPVAGAAVYVWHCNKEGEYSQYDSPMLGGDFSAHSWLRGAQLTDAEGDVAFTTILPGRYTGRAFHFHFEVYTDRSFAERLLTSQLAGDDDQVEQLYRDAGYATALRNRTLNGTDGEFRDGVSEQTLTITGDVKAGLEGSVAVTV